MELRDVADIVIDDMQAYLFAASRFLRLFDFRCVQQRPIWLKKLESCCVGAVTLVTSFSLAWSLRNSTAKKGKQMVNYSPVVNVPAKKLIESSEFEALVTLNVDEKKSLPRIEFFASPDAFEAYQASPILQFQNTITAPAPGVAFVVDVPCVEAFAKHVLPLCKKINCNSLFFYDESKGEYVRVMNDEAEEAADELEAEFENFIDSGAWQDPSVTIVDCEDLWTIEELKSLYVPGMDMEDFEKAVISAQNSAESNDYKVWGIPYGMIQDAFDEVAY